MGDVGRGSRGMPYTKAGVCVCVQAPLVPRHSWLGCAEWVFLLELGFLLRPAIPGLGVRLYVFVCARRLYPANPGSGFWACVLVGVLRLYPAIPGPGAWCGCVCVGAIFGCAPPFQARVFGCVCLCARAACTPPILSGVCCARVSMRVLAFPPPSLAGVLGRVCSCAPSAYPPPLLARLWAVGVGLRALPYLARVCGVSVRGCLEPCPVTWFVACSARFPGSWHRPTVVAWHLSVCLGCRRQHATLTFPTWCAAPRQVRSLLVLRLAFP